MSPAAHADWSDDATGNPAPPINVNTPHTCRRGSSPSAVLPQSAGTVHTSSVVSIPNRWPKDPQNANMEQTDHITILHACPASGWTTRAVYIVRSHSAANCRGRIVAQHRGRCRKKRRSGTVSFQASRADVDGTAAPRPASLIMV